MNISQSLTIGGVTALTGAMFMLTGCDVPEMEKRSVHEGKKPERTIYQVAAEYNFPVELIKRSSNDEPYVIRHETAESTKISSLLVDPAGYTLFTCTNLFDNRTLKVPGLVRLTVGDPIDIEKKILLVPKRRGAYFTIENEWRLIGTNLPSNGLKINFVN